MFGRETFHARRNTKHNKFAKAGAVKISTKVLAAHRRLHLLAEELALEQGRF